MVTTSPNSVPRSIERVRQRFERWRATRRPHRRSPIPPALWAAAIAVARQHGLCPTARTLHLDYTALKKRLAAAHVGHLTSASPTFVELPGPSALPECIIEVEGRRAILRIRLNGLARPDLIALSRAGWSGGAPR